MFIVYALMFIVYLDDLSNELNNIKAGCYIGEVLLNHLMFASLDPKQALANGRGSLMQEHCSRNALYSFKMSLLCLSSQWLFV